MDSDDTLAAVAVGIGLVIVLAADRLRSLFGGSGSPSGGGSSGGGSMPSVVPSLPDPRSSDVSPGRLLPTGGGGGSVPDVGSALASAGDSLAGSVDESVGSAVKTATSSGPLKTARKAVVEPVASVAPQAAERLAPAPVGLADEAAKAGGAVAKAVRNTAPSPPSNFEGSLPGPSQSPDNDASGVSTPSEQAASDGFAKSLKSAGGSVPSPEPEPAPSPDPSGNPFDKASTPGKVEIKGGFSLDRSDL